MKILLSSLLLLFIIQIVAVSCKFKYDIKEISSKCTKMVKDLDVKGTDNMVPSRSEAENLLKQLGAVIKISQIEDSTRQSEQWAAHPHLKMLEAKLEVLLDLMNLPENKCESILSSSEEMLESVVKLSMIDRKNLKSPMFNSDTVRYMKDGAKDIEKEIGNEDDEEIKLDYNKILGKKFKKELLPSNMKLIYSKVIPPNQNK